MVIQIIENDAGTIKAFISLSGMNIDEVNIEAEVYEGTGVCEITRVFIEITKEYGEQNLDMGRLHEETSQWESEIIEQLEKENGN